MGNIQPSGKLENIVKTFNKDQMKLIVNNIATIQLTEGCNTACPDCGLGAKPGVTDYISWNFLENLFTNYKDEFNSIRGLYFASEPFDYNDGTHNYIDVHDMFEKIVRGNLELITSFPKSMQGKMLEQIFYHKNNLGNKIKMDPFSNNKFITEISITSMNKSRFIESVRSLDFFRPENQEVIEVEYKKMICMNPGNAQPEERSVVINEEEICNQLGIKKLENSRIREPRLYIEKGMHMMGYFLRSESGSTQKLTVKPREDGRVKLNINQMPNGDYVGYHSKEISFNAIKRYFSISAGVGIRDYTTQDQGVHTQKLGPQKWDELSEKGLGCIHGVIMTPNGFFNYQALNVTKEHPYGHKITTITPKNFKVAKYYNFSSHGMFFGLSKKEKLNEMYQKDLASYEELTL
jgi:hypothetical protein